MKKSAISFVTKNEIERVKNYTEEDVKYFSLAFDSLETIEFQKRILDASLLFQDRYKIERNDSIIAASAFVNGLVLVTNDSKLFNRVSGLKTLNPMK